MVNYPFYILFRMQQWNIAICFQFAAINALFVKKITLTSHQHRQLFSNSHTRSDNYQVRLCERIHLRTKTRGHSALMPYNELLQLLNRGLRDNFSVNIKYLNPCSLKLIFLIFCIFTRDQRSIEHRINYIKQYMTLVKWSESSCVEK